MKKIIIKKHIYCMFLARLVHVKIIPKVIKYKLFLQAFIYFHLSVVRPSVIKYCKLNLLHFPVSKWAEILHSCINRRVKCGAAVQGCDCNAMVLGLIATRGSEIFIYVYISISVSRESAALRSTTYHAMPPEIGSKWGMECLNPNIKFPLSTLLCAGLQREADF